MVVIRGAEGNRVSDSNTSDEACSGEIKLKQVGRLQQVEFEDALGQKFSISLVDPEVAKRIADRLLLLKNGLRATTMLSYSRGQLRGILQDIESDRF
mgnify:CR=1 FL=1